MGNLKLVRVDYRLVHGQIVAKWIKFCPIDRLILVDDALTQDDFMSDIYRMAVPQQQVDIIKASDIQSSLDSKDDDVLLIFKDVAGAYRAWKNGIELPMLNVGAVPNGPNRKTVIQGVALSSEEYRMLKEMKDGGVGVFLQPIPENDPISIESISRKIK